MKKCFAVLVVSLFAMASTAMAEERTSWVGRDVDNNRVHWSCTRSGGDNWRVSQNGNPDTYETVADDGETLDLQLKADKRFRLRISKGTMYINQPGTKFRWVPQAEGKWRD